VQREAAETVSEEEMRNGETTVAGTRGATGGTGTMGAGAMDEEEMMNESVPVLADEEELLNASVESSGNVDGGKGEGGAVPVSMDGLVVGSDGRVLEPEGQRHRPREPLVSALQNFTVEQLSKRLSLCLKDRTRFSR
jgi:hypothetical protein